MPNNEMNSDQQSKKSLMTLAIENNPCGLCRAMSFPICKGHGGSGSGSGSGGSDSGESESKEVAYTPSQAAITAIQEFDQAKTIWVQSQLFSDKTINYEAGIFSIESDRLRGNLIFQLKPGLSKKTEIDNAHEYLKVVKKAFNSFMNELAEQGVSIKNFVAKLVNNNELTIHISNPTYFNAFIKHLQKLNLLPIPHQKQDEVASQSDKQERKKLSPFGDISQGPKPKNLKKDEK